jgi:ABC-2 type transport system ATP-binding protein
MLGVGSTALVLGTKHGRHGLRIVVLVLLVAAIIGVVMWAQKQRRDRKFTQTGGPATPKAYQPRGGGDQPAVSGITTRWNGGGGGHPNTIEARNLTKRYGEKLAVDDLSFDIQPGRVTGFLGPNGAGKSTTMRMIMGLDAPASGSVAVNGHRYHDLGWPLREVGALLEASAIHPGRSARAHLWTLARTNQIPRQRVDEVLDIVGLSSVAHQRVGQFSLGMRQRLGIAVALLGEPGVLMFDEPVNGLDTDGIRWVRNLLRGLAAEGRAVFVSSHLMNEMAVTADHVVVIGKGRLIAEMPIDEFTAQNSNAYIRVRSPRLDQLRAALVGAGATVTDSGSESLAVQGLTQERIGEVAWSDGIMLHELATQSASLEEAFVESTEGSTEFSSTAPSSGTATSAADNSKDGERR